MGKEIVFTIRLTSKDWSSELRAWSCPAIDIPSAFIKEARDSAGKSVELNLLKVEKGPARITWKGQLDQPSQMVLVVGLAEELSPISGEHFWKRLAIVIPIITALIGGAATVWAGRNRTDATPQDRTLTLQVYPNDVETSGLPPAKITVNSREVKQPIEYKIASDVHAVVDVSKAFDTYKNQNTVVASSVSNVDDLVRQLNELDVIIRGNICSGGAHGVPSDGAGMISAKLQAVSANLQRTLATPTRSK